MYIHVYIINELRKVTQVSNDKKNIIYKVWRTLLRLDSGSQNNSNLRRDVLIDCIERIIDTGCIKYIKC